MEWRDYIKATYDTYEKSKAEYDIANSLWTESVNSGNITVGKPWVPVTPPAIPDDFPYVDGPKAQPIVLGYGYPSSTKLDFTSLGRSWGVMQSSTELYNTTETQ